MTNKTVVGLTYDLVTEYPDLENAPEDIYGEFDSDETVDRIHAAIESRGYSVERIGNIHSLVQFLAAGKRVDVVFNIAEGLWGRSREGQIPSLLEAYRIPYTFSDPVTLSLSLDKAFTKSFWQLAGLPVIPFCVVEEATDFEAPLKKGMQFPLFVKPVREGSSKGVTENSLVENADQLRVQVERVISLYNQPALVEVFLPGRECTVGVIGDGAKAKVLDMLEIRKVTPQNASGTSTKFNWLAHGGKYSFHRIEEPELRQQLADLCLRAYLAIGCRDAARLDLRLDKDGQPQLLEINPLPGLSKRSALPAIAELAGLSFEMFLEGIIQSALERGISK